MIRAATPPRRLSFALRGGTAEAMDGVRRIEAFLHEVGCDAASARQLALVAEEILTNILRDAWSGREPGDCAVSVEASVASDVVQVSLRTEDDGMPFDPTEVVAPDPDTPLDERPLGGLGILLIRSMTDRQTYRRAGGRNIFEVSKNCCRV